MNHPLKAFWVDIVFSSQLDGFNEHCRNRMYCLLHASSKNAMSTYGAIAAVDIVELAFLTVNLG